MTTGTKLTVLLILFGLTTALYTNNKHEKRFSNKKYATGGLLLKDDTYGEDEQDAAVEVDVDEAKDFDYLILRQIWPATSCMFPGPNTCAIAKNITTWVVHGLWPSIKSEIGPSFCNKSLPFNYDSIKWLLPQMLEYWPNLYTNTPLDSFWKHEWEKHGTCALSLPAIKSESDYFNVTLSLRAQYDFTRILKQSAILPDDTLLLDLDKIKSSIREYLNVEPMIVCYVLKDADVQYLSQMQICLSKQFELVDCAFEAIELIKIVNSNNEPQEIQCQPGVPIHYPTIRYALSLPYFKKKIQQSNKNTINDNKIFY